MKSLRIRPRFALLAAFVALGLLSAACTNKALGIPTTGSDINAAVGRNVTQFAPAKRALKPTFAGELLGGGRLSGADLRGKIVVVNFWASWCQGCREEQPVLEQTWKKYESRGVQFVGIDIRDTRPNAKAFLREFDFDVTYPSIFDDDQSLAYAFRVLAPPSTFLLDRDGRVAVRITGITTVAGELDVLIDSLLSE